MWNGKRYRCTKCGEIYSEDISKCPHCNVLCVEEPPPVSSVALPAVQECPCLLHYSEDGVVPNRVVSMTEEQQAVVDITSGRHLVLAPPGSGKTEMLTQRILTAMRSGVDVHKMFCVTFTVRAGVEMRDRVISAISCDVTLKGKPIPDIGNIHHFCNRFLAANDLLGNSNIVDEIAQRELMKDVWIQLRKELKLMVRASSREHSVNPPHSQLEFDLDETHVEDVVSVLSGFVENVPPEQERSRYYKALLKSMDEYIENYNDKKKRSIFPELIMGVTRLQRQKVGIPYHLLRPMPRSLTTLKDNGLLSAIATAYAKIKDTYKVLDFDDLITKTYMALREGTTLKPENRFTWIQIDEVQDLNALQWEIIKMVSRDDAVSVFFGDVEQTIFSFMGASAERLARIASSCDVHYFKKNFRSTPYLLDILVRYSLRVLRSKSLFLPTPCGNVAGEGKLRYEYCNLEKTPQIAMAWLDSKCAENVALLVRSNQDADVLEREIEEVIKNTGHEIKYVKISGVEVFEIPAMRDFMAFCSLLNRSGTLMDWARMFSRFGRYPSHIARRLVKVLVDVNITFYEFFAEDEFNENKIKSQVPDAQQVDALRRVHQRFSQLWNDASILLTEATKEATSYREFFNLFIDSCKRQKLFGVNDLATYEELDQLQLKPSTSTDERKCTTLKCVALCTVNRKKQRYQVCKWEVYEHFFKRAEKFFRYLELKDSMNLIENSFAENINFKERLKREWPSVLQLREADLIVGDEKLIISTIHKAKGRQFDGVVIPQCNNGIYPSRYAKSWQDKDEDARVLYVGMSRAKKHLAICWDNERSPFLEEIEDCFKKGFIDFFKSGSTSDWLYQYKEMMETVAEKKCCRATVEKLFDQPGNGQSPDLILKRMAIVAMRYSDDVEWRDRVFGEILTTIPHDPKELDVYVEVLRAIGEMRLMSFSDKLRRGFLYSCYSPMRDDIHYAYLECYDNLIDEKNEDMSLEDVLCRQSGVLFKRQNEKVGSKCESEYLFGIEDALFDNNGDVRMEAARLLYKLTDDTRYTEFDGSEKDWRRLHGHLNEKRIQILKWMISNKKFQLKEGPKEDPWKKHLSELISDSHT